MKIISLFSGAGGFDLGLIQGGNKVVWANDIDKDAAAVVVGGFPCQDFSAANIKRHEKDERNICFTDYQRDCVLTVNFVEFIIRMSVLP